MEEKQKVGCMCSLPVVILCMCLFLPLGLILLVARIIKKRNIKKSVESAPEPHKISPVKDVVVPEDLLNKGKEIQENLKKELYCNRKDLPREIFSEIKWFLLMLAAVIGLYVYIIMGCKDFGTGLLWTLLFIGAPWPIYWNIIKRTREAKESNREYAESLRRDYQSTFNAFVFSEYIERRLLAAGVIHGEGDMPNEDNSECRKFYHYYSYHKYNLRYKYANHEVEHISGLGGFEFNDSIWKFGQFCYKTCGEYNQVAELLLFSRKPVEREVVIFRKNSGYSLNENEVKDFRKYDMDNSRFNNKFDVYAQDSIELFKVYTPAYMEKMLELSEKHGIGFASIRGNVLKIALDSNFPVLTNPHIGYDVKKAIGYAEGVFQYFMSFMENVSPIGL